MLLNIAIVPLIAALVGSVVAAPARMGGDLMVRAAASNSSSTSSNNTSTSASGSKTAAAAKKHAAGKTQNFTIDDFDVVANVQPVDPKNPDGGVNCGLLVTAGDPDLVYTPGVVGTDLVYSPPKRSLGKRTKTFSTSAAGFDLVANLNPSCASLFQNVLSADVTIQAPLRGVNADFLLTASNDQDPDLVYTPGVVAKEDLAYSPPKRSLNKRTKTFSTTVDGFDVVALFNNVDGAPALNASTAAPKGVHVNLLITENQDTQAQTGNATTIARSLTRRVQSLAVTIDGFDVVANFNPSIAPLRGVNVAFKVTPTKNATVVVPTAKAKATVEAQRSMRRAVRVL